jgi:hypothetical protein
MDRERDGKYSIWSYMSIEEAPMRCRFCKDIIEVDKPGERYIITAFSGRVKEYEHWKCYQQQMFTKVLQNIFGDADNYI